MNHFLAEYKLPKSSKKQEMWRTERSNAGNWKGKDFPLIKKRQQAWQILILTKKHVILIFFKLFLTEDG